jgi:hypothetical protein
MNVPSSLTTAMPSGAFSASSSNSRNRWVGLAGICPSGSACSIVILAHASLSFYLDSAHIPTLPVALQVRDLTKKQTIKHEHAKLTIYFYAEV